MAEPLSVPHSIPKSIKRREPLFNERQIKFLARALVNITREKIGPLEKRIEALEQSAANSKYVGVWKEGTAYRQGNFCSDHGSVWHCDTDTTRRPGQSSDWTLAVKKGADAPDPRRAATIPRAGR